MRHLLLLAAAGILLAASSCISKATPKRRFILTSPASAPANTRVSVAEVRLPTYLDDNGMHILSADGELGTLPDALWSARLSLLLRDALQTELRSQAPANGAQLNIRLDLLQCCCDTDGNLQVAGTATILPGPRVLPVAITISGDTRQAPDAPSIRRLHQRLISRLATELAAALK